MEAAFKKLISKQTTGALAATARGGLWLLSFVYRAVMAARNAAFDRKLKSVSHVGCPVISVGNITTGGTGKTPIVAWLVNELTSRGKRVVLISRGYKSVDGAANDEKLMLDQLCPGTVHLQNPDRVAAANTAMAQHAPDVIVLDDAFQHRRMGRSFDIVLIDATCPWGHGFLLPRGLLREPRTALNRADLILITRADQCSNTRLLEIRDEIHQATNHAIPVIAVSFPAIGLRNASGQQCPVESAQRKNVVAFCGIGNPDGFRQTLAAMDIVPAEFRTFPDHHHYSEADLNSLSANVSDTAALVDMFLTTHKDLVKINTNALGPIPLWAVEIGAVIGDSLTVPTKNSSHTNDDVSVQGDVVFAEILDSLLQKFSGR